MSFVLLIVACTGLSLGAASSYLSICISFFFLVLFSSNADLLVIRIASWTTTTRLQMVIRDASFRFFIWIGAAASIVVRHVFDIFGCRLDLSHAYRVLYDFMVDGSGCYHAWLEAEDGEIA